MLRKLVTVLFAITMSLSMNSLVFAADQSSAETEIPADNYQYAQGASVALNVSSSGVARIHAQLTGKTQATKLAATVILQKYNHGIWSRVDAWTDTTKSSELIIKKSVNISKGAYVAIGGMNAKYVSSKS